MTMDAGEAQPNSANSGELSILVTLWQAEVEAKLKGEAVEEVALKLSEIHARLAQQRRSRGEPELALTTVSTYLRSAVGKRLLEEVRRLQSGDIRMPARGTTAATRSPQTAYRPGPNVTPYQVFAATFQDIVAAYPEGDPDAGDRRAQAIGDFARAAGIPEETVEELREWLEKRLKPGKLG